MAATRIPRRLLDAEARMALRALALAAAGGVALMVLAAAATHL